MILISSICCCGADAEIRSRERAKLVTMIHSVEAELDDDDAMRAIVSMIPLMSTYDDDKKLLAIMVLMWSAASSRTRDISTSRFPF